MALRTIYIKVNGVWVEKIVGAVPTENNFTDALKLKLDNMTGGELTPEQLAEIAALIDLSAKQDTLVSGTNIKTVNSTSILGGGDIAIEAGEMNVNADWNASSGDAAISNKPDLTNLPTQTVNAASTPAFADVTVSGLTGAIVASESLEAAIESLDDSVASQKETGFGAWTDGSDAATYTITGGKFQLDRSGYGYINGKKVVWTVSGTSHQTGVLAVNTFYSVYIDAAGAIQTATVPFTANVIRLFEVLYDGTIYQVAKENHAKEFPSSVSGFLHKSIGTIIQGTGGNITRVATGTGASADDRRVKIVGADVLSDHGLDTTITAQNPITWNVYYRNGSGKWIRDSQVTELPIKYNNAGTPTALDITNAYASYVLYVIKDDIESAAPQYIAVMGETVSVTLAAVLAMIIAGTIIYSTNELANMEAAQLGYAVIQYSATGGYIEELQIAKSTLNQQIVSGPGPSGDHGLLSGLSDDDHSQYHNDTRGDLRYEPKKGTDDNFVTDAEKVVIGNTSGTNTGDEPSASSTVQGIIEIAIGSEVDTGTDDTRAVSPKALADQTVLLKKAGGIMSGALEAGDHGTASTDEVINVSYGTGAPPAANTTTIGSIYIQYTP